MDSIYTKKEILANLKNKLVYWRGGGYDGCIWEPNMGYLDKEGEWHPVISTGCDAIDDIETLRKEIEDDREELDIHVLDLDQEGLDWFCRHVRIDYVAHLADKLNDELSASESPKGGWHMICTECGKHFVSLDYSFGELVGMIANGGFYCGDGGIGTIVDDIFCEECKWEKLDKIMEDDWVYVCGCGPEKVRNRSWRVAWVSEDYSTLKVDTGDDEDGEPILVEVDMDDCEKEH